MEDQQDSLVAPATPAKPTHLPDLAIESIKWERAQWTDGSVHDNAFYTAPTDSADAKAGSLLRVEKDTDASLYALPPSVGISRFMYQSETMKGTPVPVSGVVLWPFAPRSSPDSGGYQVVSWAHGTCGFTPEAAPSHIINLWQHFLAPFQLVQQGYVVVATDYAGLGVARTAAGQPIVHEYLAAPAQANDVVYAVEAARQAFPQLGRQFVVMGHSQGGGAVWGVAQRQAREPVEGYLGAVAVSPVTRATSEPEPIGSRLTFLLMPGIEAHFGRRPGLETTAGRQVRETATEAEAQVFSYKTALSAVGPLLLSDWRRSAFIRQYQEIIANGGQAIGGPMLVIHSTGDTTLDVNVADLAVQETLEQHPDSQIQYVRLQDLDHNPTLDGSQPFWMDWIADRFAGRPVTNIGRQPPVQPGHTTSRPMLDWYLAKLTQPYQAP